MRIWNQVCDSDPKTLKKLEYGFKPTVIDAQSQLKKATEMFGPMGIGWGIKDEIRHFEDKWIFYSAILWYKDGDQVGEVAICSDNQIKNDCMKSCQTDALTKGLSRIGFNSDVFENQWDGDKYIGLAKEKKPKKITQPVEGINVNVKPKQPGGMSDVALEQEKQYDGSEGLDLEKLMVSDAITFQPTDKVQYGFPTLRKKTYAQCTKSELLQNKEYFSKLDNIDDKLQKHLNTIDAQLIEGGHSE